MMVLEAPCWFDEAYILRMGHPERWAVDIRRFGVGEPLLLLLAPTDEARSLAQSRYFHGPIVRAMRHLGYAYAEGKEVLCARFIPDIIHTSHLSKARMTGLIDSSLQFLAEQGIVVEDADLWRRAHRHETRTDPSDTRGHAPHTARDAEGRDDLPPRDEDGESQGRRTR